jgi:hypothetical protein
MMNRTAYTAPIDSRLFFMHWPRYKLLHASPDNTCTTPVAMQRLHRMTPR